MSLALMNLGAVARAAGDLHRAATVFRQSLALAADHGDRSKIADCVQALGRLAARAGDAPRAARLLGGAKALYDALGFGMAPFEGPDFERALAETATTLGTEAFTRARTAGQQLTLDELVAEASAELSPSYGHTLRFDERSLADSHGLSVREREVLRFVVEGHTDQEIADTLFITRRTATTHLTHILNKLGLTSRTAAATYAVRHDLV